MRIQIAVLELVMLAVFSCPLGAFGRPAEVILLRHAEKPADTNDVHLSKVGQERARALAPYLTTAQVLTNHGPINVLFATGWTKHNHRRPYETLEPLARRLDLPVEQPFLAEDYAKVARYILTSRECEGRVVVVCWIHDFLPELAHALGVSPKPPAWKKHVFDRVWVITWPHGRAQLTDLPQHLLPGDTTR